MKASRGSHDLLRPFVCLCVFFVSLLYVYISSLCIWFPAAQKARDEFDEAERALREVDDQIR